MKGLQAFAALLGSFAISAAAAQDVVALKFAHDLPETTIKARTIKLFAEKVDEYSQGKMRIDVYPGAQLVASKDEVRAAIRGQVDIVGPLTSYYVPLDVRWEVFNLPGLFSSFSESMKVLEGKTGQELLQGLERFRLHGLALWHDGPGYLYTSEKPARVPADVQGMKVRVTPSAPLEAGVRAVGGIPVSLQAPDVYLGLQQGLVSGAITTVTLAASARWYEVLTSMTRLMQQHGGYAVVINKARWDKLSDEQKGVIQRAMDDASKWNREIAEQNAIAAEKTLTDNGVQIQELTPDEMKLWHEKYKAVYAEQDEDVQKLITQVRQEIDANSTAD